MKNQLYYYLPEQHTCTKSLPHFALFRMHQAGNLHLLPPFPPRTSKLSKNFPLLYKHPHRINEDPTMRTTCQSIQPQHKTTDDIEPNAKMIFTLSNFRQKKKKKIEWFWSKKKKLENVRHEKCHNKLDLGHMSFMFILELPSSGQADCGLYQLSLAGQIVTQLTNNCQDVNFLAALQVVTTSKLRWVSILGFYSPGTLLSQEHSHQIIFILCSVFFNLKSTTTIASQDYLNKMNNDGNNNNNNINCNENNRWPNALNNFSSKK